MRYPKLRELKEAITALIKGPVTSKYPYAPHTPPKRFRGKPQPDNKGCVACKACAEVCPARAIEAKDTVTKEKAVRVMLWHLDECHYCGQCEALCTTKDEAIPGVRLTNEFELAGFHRSELVSKTEEKELALCEVCGGVVTAKAHLEWLARRLGPLAFSNPTLFLSSLKDLGLAEDVERIAKDLTRSDRIKVVCAMCRRKTTLEK